MTEMRFDNRVVIVTGAGGGLGKSHALNFAARGAKVVVNDVGATQTGEGQNASVAQLVVDEIRAAGGEATASTDSVVDGRKIVECAMDSFGQVDVVINNAGILRDVAFHKMEAEQWEVVRQVNLDGSFAVSRAAWPIMRAQGYGRIVMTTSGAGLYGNFGQANYSAAKLGLVSLAQSLAFEGDSKNIRVNTIAPVAASRLTETVMPSAMLELLKPELVTPLAVLLSHESCIESGQLFEVGGGWVARVRWERSAGAVFDPRAGYSPEDLRGQWEKVQDFADAVHPTSVMSTLKAVGDATGVDLSLAPQ